MKNSAPSYIPVLSGIGIVLLCLSLLGVTQNVSTFGRSVRIEGIPAPSQMKRIVEGTPLTVPNDKLFVATGVGRESSGDGNPGSGNVMRFQVQFDNVDVFWRFGIHQGMDGRTVGDLSIPPGLMAPGGTVVSIEAEDDLGGQHTGVLLGYLADE